MQLNTITDRYDDRLRTTDFEAVDPSANGLQVGLAGEIEHIAFAVDAAVETIDRAADAGAELFVVHHGLFWGEGLQRLTGQHYRRIRPLIEHDLALYAAHLPLDAHLELGNAAGVANLLGLEDREPFGSAGDEHVGLQGRLSTSVTVDQLCEDLATALDHAGRGVHVLDFGPDRIEDAAVVTGSGADFLDEAAASQADVLVTGEGKQSVYHRAREAGVNVVLAGHYATETFGVRSLLELADDWGLETTFIDCPTGL